MLSLSSASSNDAVRIVRELKEGVPAPIWRLLGEGLSGRLVSSGEDDLRRLPVAFGGGGELKSEEGPAVGANCGA